ncbi:MAG: PEP/pyruvate-binding domain-containing protein [bacterium]
MKDRTVYLFPSQDKATLSEVGGKGLSLMAGSQQGLPVPPGFILTVAFFKSWFTQLKSTKIWDHFLNAKEDELENASTALKSEVAQFVFANEQQQELSKNLEHYGKEVLFAVRSSSPEEDLEGSSFAGGYETVLGVTSKNMENAIKRAFASCLDYRVAVYKRQNGFDIKDPKIAVVVQQQIGSDIAGVGFSLNPVTNNYDDAVFNSNWGLGETVVAGTATPDTFIVDKISLKIKDRTLGKKETSIWLLQSGGTQEKSSYRSTELTLSDAQIIELVELIKKVEKLYKKPMDIEWAYSQGKLYLLQARPISVYVPLSSVMTTQPGESKRLYIDFTISTQGIEQPTSVVGTSFFQTFFTIVGKIIFWRDITRNIATAIPWVENGRVYLNLSNVLRLFNKNKVARFMSNIDSLVAKTIQAMDEKEYVSRTYKLQLLPFGMLTKLPRIALHVYKARLNPERTHLDTQKKLELFIETVHTVAEKETSLVKLANKLTQSFVDNVLFNTIPLFILGNSALGKMKKIAGKDLEDAFVSFDVALPNNVTIEMGFALYRVSKLLPKGLDLITLENGIERNNLPESFLSAWKDFLRVYGHRGPVEIDVAAPRYRDDPALLLNLLLSMRNTNVDDNPEEKFKRKQNENQNAYTALLEKIWGKSGRQAKNFQLHHAIFETFAGYRETHKYYLTLVTYVLRERILRDAKDFLAEGRLESLEQIFDLTLENIDKAKADKPFDLIRQAKNNKVFINRLIKVPQLPTMIDSRGHILRPPTPPIREGEVAGTPISAGVVRGRIKVLHSLNEKTLNKGEILVARSTNPGWTPLFVNAAAVILEVGGSLQHGALVAREYGLPCVAGIESATSLWKDGTLVEVDGSAGIVRLVAKED